MSARLFLIWLILACAQAAAENPESWAAGQASFQGGDYPSALLHFEAARDAGQSGPAVHYNIAVCNFELEQYRQAREGFAFIAGRYPQMQGLAEYNLGLIAQREGDTTAATRHFLRAYENSQDNKTLRILASNRLRELEPASPESSNWSGAIGLRAGFDDNIVLRDETGLSAVTATDSPTADLFASIQGPWNSDSGFRVEGSLYAVRNFDADDFDQTEVLAGAMYDWLTGDWRLRAGGHYSVGTLGGDAFDRKAGVSVRATRYLSKQSSLDVAYIYDDVSDADTLFAGIAGSRQQFRAGYRWRLAERSLLVQLRQEGNDRADPGVSPDRIGLRAYYRFQPRAGWGYEGGITFRASDYDELPIPRSEDLLSVHAALTRTLQDDWLISLEYRYSDNDSSDRVFSYDRQQVSLGVMRVF